MQNFKLQNACINCKHVFVFEEYDCGDEYFCNIEKSRPACGSVLLGEQHCTPLPPHGDKEAEELYYARSEAHSRLWDEWSKKFSVVPHGICDSYSQKL